MCCDMPSPIAAVGDDDSAAAADLADDDRSDVVDVDVVVTGGDGDVAMFADVASVGVDDAGEARDFVVDDDALSILADIDSRNASSPLAVDERIIDVDDVVSV